MRLIKVNKKSDLSRQFQDNPRRAFDRIIAILGIDGKLTSDDVYAVLGKRLVIGDFSVSRYQFGIMVNYLNNLHDGIKQQGSGKLAISPGLDHPEIIDNMKKYSKIAQGNIHYLDAYRPGLIM